MSVTVCNKEDANDYIEVNKKSWDSRAASHAASTTYNIGAFLESPTYLSPTLSFDIPRLPSLQGLNVTHLQCHIGTDTLSLARLGAASVTGLDFSAESLKQARALASINHGTGGSKLRFVEGDVYDSVSILGPEQYDFVFTGIGSLGWLPSVSRWARVVSGLLKKGGQLFIREGHPVLWAIDESVSEDNPEQQLRITFPYFEDGRPIVNTAGIMYTENDKTQAIEQSTAQVLPTKEFNHGLGEIIQSVLDVGMRIIMVHEHDSVPWNALPGRMEKSELSEYRLKQDRSRLPCTFTLRAVKM